MATPPSNNTLSQSRPIKSTAELSAEIGALDGDLAKLKVRFDQHFLGLERKPPTDELDRIRRAVMGLKRAFTNNTAMKFRIDTLYQKFKSYEQLWTKTLREIEEGTYRKDLMRLRLQNLKKAKNPSGTESGAKSAKKSEEVMPQFGEDELDAALGALDGDMFSGKSGFSAPTDDSFVPTPVPIATPAMPIAPRPPASTAAIRGGTPKAAQPSATRPIVQSVPRQPILPTIPAQRPTSSDAISHDRIDQIYREYVSAKRQCNENTSGITRDALAKSIQKRMSEGNDVKVIIRNGKAMLSLVKKS